MEGKAILNNEYKDDDLDVWKYVYKNAYENKIIGKNFNIVNPKIINGRYASSKNDDDNITISGETDFNFSDKLYIVGRKTKYKYYSEILETIEDIECRQKCIELLNYCCNMTNKIVNFSLMQTTGALQAAKGVFTATDRIDTFIHVLNNYYLGIDEMVLSRCTAASTVNKLRGYLDLFKDTVLPENSIYKYCSEVYHISSRGLVDDLIKSGRCTICTVDELIDYMILAVRFWNSKSYYYKNVGICKSWNLKFVKKQEYLPSKKQLAIYEKSVISESFK